MSQLPLLFTLAIAFLETVYLMDLTLAIVGNTIIE